MIKMEDPRFGSKIIAKWPILRVTRYLEVQAHSHDTETSAQVFVSWLCHPMLIGKPQVAHADLEQPALAVCTCEVLSLGTFSKKN